MFTSGVVKERDGPANIGHELIAMALMVVMERICRLPSEDRDELFVLCQEIPKAESAAELDEIREVMIEILDRRPGTVEVLRLNDQPAPEKLERWKHYVGGRVKELREAAGLTQEELSKRTGLPQSHISRIETAKHSPSRLTIEKIAKALRKTVADFDCNEDR